MYIKRIIREEISSDWGWVDDVGMFHLPTVIIFDPPLREKEPFDKITKVLEEDGFEWVQGLGKPTEWSPFNPDLIPNNYTMKTIYLDKNYPGENPNIARRFGSIWIAKSPWKIVLNCSNETVE